jgi:hypothetical protein
MAIPFKFCGTNAAAGSTTATVSVTASTAEGDNLALAVGASASGSTPSQITDTQNNTWTLQDSQTTNLPYLYVFVCEGAAALSSITPDLITITYTGSTSAVFVTGVDSPGTQQSVDIDVKATGTSASPSKSTGTLGSAVEQILIFETNLNAGGTIAWTGGTVLDNESNGTSGYVGSAYLDTTAVTAQTVGGAITSSTWNLIAISFPAAPVMVTTILSGAVQNQPYSQTLEATGGTGTYTWAVTSGSLPVGLTLASGVISGTPTALGSTTFTVTATDGVGTAGGQVETVVVATYGTTATGTTLYANQLTNADAFGSTGFSWIADVNANAPALSVNMALDSTHGLQSISWSSAADGDSSIHTKMYPCKANAPFIASLWMFMTNINASTCSVGIEWYTSGGTLIRTDLSEAASMGAIQWCPQNGLFTAPSNASQYRMVAYVYATNEGDVNYIDLNFAAEGYVQVLVDWINPTFPQGSNVTNMAGAAFMDISSWVRLDQNISLQRGRQDSISDVSSGSASFLVQNDSGVFSPQKSAALCGPVSGGYITLGRRCQVNAADELGKWHTRFDGTISEIDDVGENTGNTNLVTITCADILAYMNRSDPLLSWTRELVRSDGPLYTWALDDTGNAGHYGQGVESSGNNGPPMRTFDKDSSNVATIAWQDSTGGVETLADAVALTKPDGSEYWSAGQLLPTSPLRGLDSGTVGPYSTPQSSVYLTPQFSAQATLGQNSFIGNNGYCLFAELPETQALAPNVAGGDFSIEMWFTCDTSNVLGTPATAMAAATNVGPYVQLSLGSSRTLACVAAGMYFNTTSAMKYELNLYNQPPSFIQNSPWPVTGGPTPAASTSTPFVPDRIPTTSGNATIIGGGSLPHHLVLVAAGAVGGGTMTLWLDGVEVGSIQLYAGQTFDTIYVGGAFGGQGAHFGNASLCSLYQYQLSGTQIVNHASMGQYAMWEQTTDNAVAQLGVYADIPSYYNNLSASNLGLTLTDYQDITGSNALSGMQIFEQAELGLIYVNGNGALTYHTRDWRMGYGAPDLLLPPGTYDANMNHSLLDQFLCNEAGTNTNTYQTGAAFVNQVSKGEYGDYTLSSAAAPTQLPLITWSRSYALLGLPQLAFWPDPALNDYSTWLANNRSEPWLLPGSLTVDMLAPDTAQGCPTISQWYGIDIDNLIAPTGAMPAWWPDMNLSSEWFVEGINEIISDTQRVLTVYTSPAETQRAWKPGDSTYGVLGVTSRIGISGPDTNVVIVQGKDVSHDAGPPYFAPSITQTMNNPSANSHDFIGALDMRGIRDNLAQVLEPPMLMVGASGNAQSLVTGAVLPQVRWDTVFLDTANGMGAVAGWPNWYVVTVPGFYEIDACVIGSAASSGDAGAMQAWVIVANEAAQGLASGLATPQTVNSYMCPIGEQRPLNNNNDNTALNSSFMLYLGIGDMVAVGAQHSKGSNKTLATNYGGSKLSLRWISNSVYADHCRNNTNITTGGIVTDATVFTPQTLTYPCTATYSYYGTASSKTNPGRNQRVNTNGNMYQGQAVNDAGNTGSMYGVIKMPYASMATGISGLAGINSVTLTGHCNNSVNQPHPTSDNPQLMLGYTAAAAADIGEYTYEFNNTGDNPDLSTLQCVEGQDFSFNIGTTYSTAFAHGGAKALTIGNNSTIKLQYYGWFSGGPGAWTITVNGYS